jgi:hypothetical protein
MDNRYRADSEQQAQSRHDLAVSIRLCQCRAIRYAVIEGDSRCGTRTRLGDFGGPEYEVVAEQLEDHDRIARRVLRQLDERGERLVECVLGEVTRAHRARAHIAEVNGKVEREPKPRRMPGLERTECMLVRRFVRLERQLRVPVAFLGRCDLIQVAIVIALPDIDVSVRRGSGMGVRDAHLVVEYLLLSGAGGGE